MTPHLGAAAGLPRGLAAGAPRRKGPAHPAPPVSQYVRWRDCSTTAVSPLGCTAACNLQACCKRILEVGGCAFNPAGVLEGGPKAWHEDIAQLCLQAYDGAGSQPACSAARHGVPRPSTAAIHTQASVTLNGGVAAGTWWVVSRRSMAKSAPKARAASAACMLFGDRGGARQLSSGMLHAYSQATALPKSVGPRLQQRICPVALASSGAQLSCGCFRQAQMGCAMRAATRL